MEGVVIIVICYRSKNLNTFILRTTKGIYMKRLFNPKTKPGFCHGQHQPNPKVDIIM